MILTYIRLIQKIVMTNISDSSAMQIDIQVSYYTFYILYYFYGLVCTITGLIKKG